MELYIVIALLALIAISEMYRTYLGLKTPSKKEHFKRKLQGTRNMIWDLQFKVFKTRDIRESIRQEYDYVKSRIETLESQIQSWPKDGNVDEFKRLEDQKVLAERDMNRFVGQMKQLDLEVEGSKPTAEFPNGAEGTVHQIDSLRELEKMLQDWISGL